MYTIKVKAVFSAAHNLKNYKGKCEHLHGHNWIVEAAFSYSSLDKEGLAIDFQLAKRLLKNAVEKFDHSYLNKLELFKKTSPTSENIAKLIYDSIKLKNPNLGSVSVWENENSCAVYTQKGAL